MDNLSQAHLAPYLPYGLKILNGWGDIKTLNYTHLDDENNGFIQHVKPLLRPLSDLTKEIEQKGEKFVPILQYHYLRFDEISTFKGGENHLIFMQVREYQILLELHFDVFGLIEKGLAIDIKKATNE
jgi:hypothetical protein